MLALAAIWPRKFAALDPWVLRQFLTYDSESAGLKLHDTIAETVTLGGKVLKLKARNLKLALLLLLLAVLIFGAGTAFTSTNASVGRTHHGIQQHARQPVRSRVSPSASASASAYRFSSSA